MPRVVAHRKRRATFQLHNDYATGLSSAQIWETLCSLLEIAVGPVFEYTEFGIDLCLSLLSASMDKRRKVSIYRADVCRGILFYTIVYDSGQDVLRKLRDIGVERNLIVDPILDALTQNKLPGALLPNSPFTEQALIRHVKQGMEPYLLFRRQVAERYVKLADSMGKKNAWVKSEHGLVSDPNEHTNNYMLSVFRAIDKFYPHKGTLANYVTRWMDNAAGSVYSVYFGEAYTVPRSHRRSLVDDGNQAMFGNFALPLEDAAVIADTPAPETYHDGLRIFNSLYDMSVLFPAMLDFDFPVTISPEELAILLKAPNIVKIGEQLANQMLDAQQVAIIADNLNFNNKRERRRKT